MDWLRIFAFLMLTMYHINMYFVPWPWHVNRTETALWLVAPMIAVNPWRLILLFVVAGYASTALMTKHQDMWHFVKDRSYRLLLPTIFAIIVLIPVQPWIDIMVNKGYFGTYWQFYTQEYWAFSWDWGIYLPTWQHLWFVCYLWAYSLIFACLVALTSSAIRSKILQYTDDVMAGLGIIVIPAAFFTIIMLMVGIDNVAMDSWIRMLPAQPVYIASCLFGCYLFGAKKGWTAIRRYWPLATFISIILVAVAIGIRLGWNAETQPHMVTMVFAISRPILAWVAVIALIGIADRFFNKTHRFLPMLTESVFPIYIIHKSIIVVTGYVLLTYAFPMALDYMILLVLTLGGSWVYYLLCKHLSFLRPLAGLKRQNSGQHTMRLATRPATG